jgi:hypothetical protein
MRLLALAGCCFSVMLAQSANLASSEYPEPTIREEQQITVDGVNETWQLRWSAVPKPYCEPAFVALTCPCGGFAYGEAGDLSVIRLRGGVEFDRLRLSPFFSQTDHRPVIQRWAPDYVRDGNGGDFQKLARQIRRRPVVPVMHFGDYDHDGNANEFFLQTGVAPCLKSTGVVIGISKTNPRLHAFGTAAKPQKPLTLQKREWEALLHASRPVKVLDWACDDHVSTEETILDLRWTEKGIDGVCRFYACPYVPGANRPIRQGSLYESIK